MSLLTRVKATLKRVDGWESRAADAETAIMLVEDGGLGPDDAAEMLQEAARLAGELEEDLDRCV
jgi:hypothetical protein